MTNQKDKKLTNDSPQEMLKRLLAVADVIIQSDSYQGIVSKQQNGSQKHKSEDMVYRSTTQ